MKKIKGLYIHFPFCIRKCPYCDFVSWGNTTQREQESYVDLLLAELSLLKIKTQEKIELETLYFGGGTPSLLATEQLQKIIKKVGTLFDGKVQEMTLEVNPATLNEEKAKLLAQIGINRVSLGVQSFDDGLLKKIGRDHDAQKVRAVVMDLKKNGITNISIDLIYGLPGQNLFQWQQAVETALELDVPHLSFYGLKLDEGSFWGKEVALGKREKPDEDLKAEMLQWAMSYLPNKGYQQYEISNFARAGFASKHNLIYWHQEHYLGIGVSAAAYYEDKRCLNVSSLSEYEEKLKKQELPLSEIEYLNDVLKRYEYIMLQLRLQEGIDPETFTKLFQLDFFKKYQRTIQKHQALGLLAVSPVKIALTNKGILLANEVIADFWDGC